MTHINPQHGLGTLVNHVAEEENPYNAQVKFPFTRPPLLVFRMWRPAGGF